MAGKVFIRVGSDIIELKRIRKASRNPRFLANYFSADEIRFLVAHKLSTELIAENYCAKIAFAKAIGTGFRIIKPQEITVLRDRLGSPFIITTGRAKMLEEREHYVFNLSVAHCKDYAMATVIINRE